jgi:hypothetical protein
MTWRQQPAIWQVSDLPPTAKLVLLALAFFSNARGGGAYPAQATLATMCCVSIPTIKRALRTLRDRQLIELEGKGRHGTIKYRIALPLSHRGGSLTTGGEGSPVIYNPVDRYPVNKKGKGDSIDDYQAVNKDGPELNPAGHETLVNLGVRKR